MLHEQNVASDERLGRSGVLVIGGLVSSTLLTMVVVPVAYVLVDDLGRAAGRLRARLRSVLASPPAETPER